MVRSGLALGSALLAGEIPVAQPVAARPERLAGWEAIRAQFPLSRDLIHLAGFFLASHPTPVRNAIERHRAGLDANPIGYWIEHEEKQEAAVLRAAAGYLGADPTEIALTDSTTMGLGLLYGSLALRPGQEILTTTHDHYSTEISLRLRAERTGATIRQVPLYRLLQEVSRDSLIENLIREIKPDTCVAGSIRSSTDGPWALPSNFIGRSGRPVSLNVFTS